MAGLTRTRLRKGKKGMTSFMYDYTYTRKEKKERKSKQQNCLEAGKKEKGQKFLS